jgi:hypothetical protein
MGGIVVDMDEHDELEERLQAAELRTLKRPLRSELPVVPYLTRT